MKKKIKLYLHHSHYEPLSYSKRTGFFGLVASGLEMISNAIMLVCYAVGISVINVVLLPITLIKLLIALPQNVAKVVKEFHHKKFRRTIGAFALIALVVTSGIHGLSLIAVGQDLKGEVLGASEAGLGYLQEAKTSLESQNTAAAQANFNKALEQFRNSSESLNSTSLVLQGLLAAVPQKHDADKLLLAAQKMTEAGLKGTELLTLTDNMKLSAVGLSGGDKNRQTLEQAQALLNDSVKLADEAAALVNDVSISSIPEQYRQTFIGVKDTANFFQANVASIKEVCSLVFDLLLGQKNTLIVFQNNNELRASGGFMGTIGNAKLSDGSLTSLDIRSVYDWDGQLNQKILPPSPMLAVNDRWYLRDSNWFASFPESADRISTFFEKEGGETPDLIIAMTPEVILEMLDRTGPINLPQHKITLTKDNFIEETQTATSVNYDKTLNQPKQFLADFFPMLMERLGSSENGGIIGFLEVFQQNLYEKQIVLFSRDENTQRKILAFNWGGQFRETDRDYLSVVSTNLGGTKTDRFLEKTIDLKSKVEADGTITNTLTYTVANPLPSGPSMTNKSFIRFYVPAGANLISTQGFNQNIQLPQISSAGYTLDPKVQEWQKNVVQETTTNTFLGTESGKSWFGNWLEVGGKETKTVTLTYELPFKLGKIDRYSLLVQRQPGSQADNFNFELNFSGRRSLWNSNSTNIEGSSLKYSQNLLADTFLGSVLEK